MVLKQKDLFCHNQKKCETERVNAFGHIGLRMCLCSKDTSESTTMPHKWIVIRLKVSRM